MYKKTFLLLDESERDNRLLSTSTLNLTQNGHATIEEVIQEKTTVEEPKKKDISVVCNLKQARWEQVYYLTVNNKIESSSVI